MKKLMFLLFVLPTMLFAETVPQELVNDKRDSDWWSGQLTIYLDRFSTDYSKLYGENGNEMVVRTSLAYGLLNAYMVSREALDAINIVFNDKTKANSLRDVLYNWVVEPLTNAFLRLEPNMKNIYKGIIKEAINRLESFDYDAELAYYNSLKDKGDFTYLSPDGREDPYRKINAFIFRRIHNNGLSIGLLKYWADKIDRDIFNSAQ